MAGPTLATLRGYMYRFISEPSADTSNPLFPTAQIDAWINGALQSIPRRLDHDLFRTTANINAATGNLALPSTSGSAFLCHLRVFFRPDTSTSYDELQAYTQNTIFDEDPDWLGTTATGLPDRYIMRLPSGTGGAPVIRLYPQPDTTYTNGLLLYYTVAPPALSADSDTADILQYFPEQQFTYVPFWVAHRATFFEGGPTDDQGQKFEALVERELAQMRLTLKTLAGNVIPATGYRRR